MHKVHKSLLVSLKYNYIQNIEMGEWTECKCKNTCSPSDKKIYTNAMFEVLHSVI